MTFVQPTEPYPTVEETERPQSDGALDHVRITRGAALYGLNGIRAKSPAQKQKSVWWRRFLHWLVKLS